MEKSRDVLTTVNTILCIGLYLCLLFGYTNTIDTSLPSGSDDPAEADDNMRRIQGGYQEILAVEHNVDLTGTVITGDGTHTDITTDSIVNAGTLTNTGTITASGAVTVGTTLDVTGNIDPTTYETTNGGFLDEDDLASDANDKVASQQSTKAYVDTQIAAIGSLFGVWNDRDDDGSGDTVSTGTSYTAATDGIVVAYVADGSHIRGETPTGTTRCYAESFSPGAALNSLSMPVRNGDTWKVTALSGSGTVFWMPIGK